MPAPGSKSFVILACGNTVISLHYRYFGMSKSTVPPLNSGIRKPIMMPSRLAEAEKPCAQVSVGVDDTLREVRPAALGLGKP